MLVILIIEKDTTVAMIASIFRAADPKLNCTIRQLETFNQRNVQGTAMRRVVLALASGDLERPIAVFLCNSPSLGVENLPSICTPFKVFFEDLFSAMLFASNFTCQSDGQ